MYLCGYRKRSFAIRYAFFAAYMHIFCAIYISHPNDDLAYYLPCKDVTILYKSTQSRSLSLLPNP
jgi:hypothetical protein